ncbi:MAG: hypothetical protein PHW65_00020 [Dehalococcoidales bacterium]|nr:hypothetical protein [Dehalococcoidales bacterium]
MDIGIMQLSGNVSGNASRRYGYEDDDIGGKKPSNPYYRLLSPAEYDGLPEESKYEFDSYMDYVRKFNKINVLKKNHVPQGGGPFYGRGFSSPSSKTGASGGVEKGATKIPDYRKSTDIFGNVSFLPSGDIRQTITGRIVPQSLESAKTAIDLRSYLPKMELESELDIATKEAQIAEQRALKKAPKAKLAEEKSELDKIKAEQGQQKIDISKATLVLRNKSYQSRLSDAEYKEAIKQENRHANIILTDQLRQGRDEQRMAYDWDRLLAKGEIPGTPEAIDKDLRELNEFRNKALINLDNATTLEDKKFHNRTLEAIEDKLFWFEKERYRILPFGAERDEASLEEGQMKAEQEKESLRTARPTPDSYWSEKQKRWWRKDKNGNIQWE